RGHRVIEVQQAARRLVGGQRRDRVMPQPHPPAVRVVLLDQITPYRDRQVVLVLAVPGDLLHGEPALSPGEYRSAEKELQRNAAVTQSVQIFGRSDLEVVGALEGER